MNEIKVDIFCDEIKEITQKSVDGESHKWMYIGLLIVPLKNKLELFNSLMTRRCGNKEQYNWDTCKNDCEYHRKNGTEVHYQNLRSSDVYFIAKRWSAFFLEDNRLTYFYMLGIETTKINNAIFGDVSGEERFNRIYNRYFRMAIKKALKSFFCKYDKIVIRNIFHDKANIESDPIFSWHICYKLPISDDKIFIESEEIVFIDSDHKKSENRNSHFIQYTDLILGLFFNSFHGLSSHKYVTELSTKILPLTERLIKAPANKNSSYRYFKRLEIDFFPRFTITAEDSLENEVKRMNSFYKNREIIILSKKQPELF